MPSESEPESNSEKFNESSTECASHLETGNRIDSGIVNSLMQIFVPNTYYFLVLFVQMSVSFFVANNIFDEKTANLMGIGETIFNAFGLYWVTGITGGLEIVGAQSFGSKNFRLLGIFYQKTRLIGFAFAIILQASLLLFGKNILNLFNTETVNVDAWYDYAVPTSFVLLIEVQVKCLVDYLNIINKPEICIFISTITLVFHCFNVYLSMFVFQGGMFTLSMCFVMSHILNAVLLTIYVHWVEPHPESMISLDEECFEGLWDYFIFSVPSALIIVSDYMSWEVISLVASLIGAHSYNAHICINQYSLIIYCGIIGVSVGTTVMVGNEIIKGSSYRCKQVFSHVMACAFAYAAICNFTLWLFKFQIAKFSSPYQEVQTILEEVIYIACWQSFFDTLQVVANSYLKAIGKQKLCSYISLLNNYFLNTVLAFVVGVYLDWGLSGIYWAFLFITALNFFLFMLVILGTDLDDQITKLQYEMEENEAKLQNYLEQKTTRLLTKSDSTKQNNFIV